MRNEIFYPVLIAAALFAAVQALCQDTQPMDARDMFYSAADMLPGRKTAPPPAKKKAAERPPAKAPARHPVPEMAHVTPPANPEYYFQLAAQTERPLGLRYGMLIKTAGGLVEATPGQEFHTGDLIRLSVMGNQKGYLYVVGRGSSGVWSLLFPNPESAQRSNEIVAGRQYQVPGGPGEYFTLDEQTGEERIFILLARHPVADLDGLVRGMAAGDRQPPPLIEANYRVTDDQIAQLRDAVQTRDLVFTKVDEPAGSGGAAGEKAVYVVNKNAADGDRVVTDVTIHHR